MAACGEAVAPPPRYLRWPSSGGSLQIALSGGAVLSLAAPAEDTAAERRVDPTDGKEYTYFSFCEFYGSKLAPTLWERAAHLEAAKQAEAGRQAEAAALWSLFTKAKKWRGAIQQVQNQLRTDKLHDGGAALKVAFVQSALNASKLTGLSSELQSAVEPLEAGKPLQAVIKRLSQPERRSKASAETAPPEEEQQIEAAKRHLLSAIARLYEPPSSKGGCGKAQPATPTSISWPGGRGRGGRSHTSGRGNGRGGGSARGCALQMAHTVAVEGETTVNEATQLLHELVSWLDQAAIHASDAISLHLSNIGVDHSAHARFDFVHEDDNAHPYLVEAAARQAQYVFAS